METPTTLTIDLEDLAQFAWRVRAHAFVIGNTPVGCALLADDGRVYAGCNVEHRYRCHDVHAEINAITSMVAGGAKSITALVIVAERDFFTPCGGCMDWIMQFGANCIVGFQRARGGKITQYTPKDLMPLYPC